MSCWLRTQQILMKISSIATSYIQYTKVKSPRTSLAHRARTLEDQEKKAKEREKEEEEHEVVGKKRHEETSTALSLILSQLQGQLSNS